MIPEDYDLATIEDKCQLRHEERSFYASRHITKLGVRVMLNETMRHQGEFSTSAQEACPGRYQLKKRGPRVKSATVPRIPAKPVIGADVQSVKA